MARSPIPRVPWPDDTLRFLRDGYLFGSRGFARVGGDAFRTRLIGRPVVVVRGWPATRFFYEGGRFDRSPGAVPRSAVELLQDHGSVQTLEGGKHAARKSEFVRALDADGRSELARLFEEEWARKAQRSAGAPVSLHDFASGVLAEAAGRWTGATAVDGRAAVAAAELESMIENAGRFGAPNWAARARRSSLERRLRTALEDGSLRPHRPDLSRLPPDIAVVELLNVLRPTVAVARYIVFAALALHRLPGWRERVASSADDRRAFAQEVRRFFPFFPAVGGHATAELDWQGHRLQPGDWVLLDLYGTDHSPAHWESPARFDPERFLGTGHAVVVAQGFGDPVATHHCPGESATVDLLERALMLLASGGFDVPPQDLRISLRRFPALPEDGMHVIFRRTGVYA